MKIINRFSLLSHRQENDSASISNTGVDHPVVVENFLTPDRLQDIARLLKQKTFEDGNISAGRWARQAKKNKQANMAEAEPLGKMLVDLLFEDKRIARSIYPHRTVQPLFNRYGSGDYYALHEDNPIQSGIRADISYTLFLSDPATYEGGALCLNHSEKYRLPAGSLLLYNAGIPHEVEEITRGVRLAAVGWIQSVVRDPVQRMLLRSFYQSMHTVEKRLGVDHSDFHQLNRIRNQLMRMWADL